GMLRLQTDGAARRMRVPGLCPVELPARHGDPRAQRLTATPLLSVPETMAQVGFDTPFSIRVTPGCDQAARATLRWRQVEGLPLALTTSERGQLLQAKTLPLSSYFPQGIPDGIVPFSPRTQGRYVLEALAEGLEGARAPLRVTVTSIARATGLPSLAVSQRVLLGGAGWHTTRVPPGSRARVMTAGQASAFQPDVPGRFELTSEGGQHLELSALTHDLTPLDCGRSECHAALTSAALSSPMSQALQRPFLRGGASIEQQGCMLDCHAVGEPGLHDGGYRDVARALQFEPALALRTDQLPHALQRLAGVRCTSCHGPGAVPPQSGRARILRADVCATCHDAPPAYNHVAQWRASRMAQADAAPATRAQPECAQCHTTSGFLHRSGVRARADASRDSEDAVVGISCAACHAPHAAQQGQALVRKLDPALLASVAAPADAVSSVCTPCHSPIPERSLPAASGAALWLGRIELPRELGGARLTGPAPHGALEGGCVGCHGKREPPSTKTDHSFKADPSRCGNCHDDEARAQWDAEERALRTRAEALWRTVAMACGYLPDLAATPLHAHGEPPRCRSHGLTRARYLVALVIEDGAAFQHNAPFARQLLEQA
ncbi:MAG TPA: hypothetical protein VFZ61_16190, partial [Polyangiales bacterium]